MYVLGIYLYIYMYWSYLSMVDRISEFAKQLTIVQRIRD